MPPFAESRVAGDRQGIDGGWSVEVVQSEYAHDIVRFTGTRVAMLGQRYPNGAPVLVTYGRGADRQTTFVGYVHHTRPRLVQNTLSSGVLVAVGASHRELSGAGFSNWPAGSAAQVPVQQTAFDAHFSSLVESSDLSAVGGPMQGETQWQYLVRNARESGFTFYCAATDLRFHSRRISMIAPVPTFTWYGRGIVSDAQVHSYEFLQGDDLPDGARRRARTVSGVSDNGDLVRISDDGTPDDAVGWATTSTEPLTATHRDQVHGSLYGSRRLSGVRDLNRFFYRAKVTVSGDERVRQASTVSLSGIDQYLDGYWYVLKAAHRIGTAAYSMELELGRDALGDTSPAVQPDRQVVIGPGVRERQRPSAPQLERFDRTHRQLAMSAEQTGRWSSTAAETRTHVRQGGPVSG